MSDGITLYKHNNYQPPSVSWAGPNSTKGIPRIKGFSHQSLQYHGLYKEISSFKFQELHPDYRVTTILFKENAYEGDFVAFFGQKPGRNIPSLGAHNFNDETASILMVNHALYEHVPLPLGAVMGRQATDVVDDELSKAVQSRGVKASRRGELVFTWDMRPGFAQYKMLVQIDIPIEVSMWPGIGYDALVSYFIYPYLDGQHRLRGRVAWVKGWVEGGTFSSSICSQLKAGATSQSTTGRLEQELNDLLESLDYQAWEGFYLMPGSAPLQWKDYKGNTRDDVTLVLVRQ